MVTINARTSEILVANDVACDMFAYTHDELIGMRMSKMFTKSDEAKPEAIVEQHIEENGTVVMVSGKVVSHSALLRTKCMKLKLVFPCKENMVMTSPNCLSSKRVWSCRERTS